MEKPRQKALRYPLGLLLLVGTLFFPSACSRQRGEAPLLVSAAASLTNAFRELGAAFTKESGIPLQFNFGSTGLLAEQIARGAPVDLFAAASARDVEALRREGLLLPETVTPYAEGRLVLWPRGGLEERIEGLRDLLRLERIAIANPSHAPYGLAARQALVRAGLWERLAPRIVFGENVRQTLKFAETGNVDVAIVAHALCPPGEGGWVEVSPALHDPIVQTVAIPVTAKRKEAARRLLAFIVEGKGQAILARHGFLPPRRKGER